MMAVKMIKVLNLGAYKLKILRKLKPVTHTAIPKINVGQTMGKLEMK